MPGRVGWILKVRIGCRVGQLDFLVGGKSNLAIQPDLGFLKFVLSRNDCLFLLLVLNLRSQFVELGHDSGLVLECGLAQKFLIGVQQTLGIG